LIVQKCASGKYLALPVPLLCILAFEGCGTRIPAVKQDAVSARRADSSYIALVEIARKNTDVDFTALRLLYAGSSFYQPYEHFSQREMLQALRVENYREALSYAQKTIAERFVDFEAHVICRSSYLKLGDTADASFHEAIARGLLGSILASGNGRDIGDSAFVVIMVPEEYAVLDFFRLRLLKQALVEKNGHAYDQMTVEYIDDKTTDTLYFNVDLPINWWKKETGKK
jgi:hypothetical protein